MARIYYKDQFIAHARQQIIENNDLIRGYEIISQVLPKYDGKVTNKRITDALEQALKAEFQHAYVGFDLMVGYSRLNLTIRDHDHYPTPSNDGKYHGCDYVRYESSAYMPDTDNKRLDADKTIAAINKSIESLQRDSAALAYEAEHINEIETEYNAIRKQIEQFNEKYSYSICELYNLRR